MQVRLASPDAVLEDEWDDHGEDAGEEDDGDEDVRVHVLVHHEQVAHEPHRHWNTWYNTNLIILQSFNIEVRIFRYIHKERNEWMDIRK